MSVICIVILFFVCMVLYKPGFKFFLFWLVICAAVSYFLSPSAGLWGVLFVYTTVHGNDSFSERTSTSNSSRTTASNSKHLYDKVYRNGTYRTENLSNTGYYYSDGKESWLSFLGEEHRNNGEVVRDNAFLTGRRDIYNSAGDYVGYEYEDSLGITHRIDK